MKFSLTAFLDRQDKAAAPSKPEPVPPTGNEPGLHTSDVCFTLPHPFGIAEDDPPSGELVNPLRRQVGIEPVKHEERPVPADTPTPPAVVRDATDCPQYPTDCLTCPEYRGVTRWWCRRFHWWQPWIAPGGELPEVTICRGHVWHTYADGTTRFVGNAHQPSTPASVIPPVPMAPIPPMTKVEESAARTERWTQR